MNKWDERFLDIAKTVSNWSKDPSSKVGAVITNQDNRIISLGFNGLPSGMEDKDEILENRELKYRTILHAEENAILFARQSLEGFTIYTYPMQPCIKCTSFIIQTGIKRVVSFKVYNERWNCEFETSLKHFADAGVEVVLYDEIINL